MPRDRHIKVGSLGVIKLSRGYYAYVGSGGANILKRVDRHFRRGKRLRWHIDYVTTEVRPLKAYILKDPPMEEDSLAEFLGGHFSFIPRFGASDSRFSSHFFYLGMRRDIIRRLRSLLETIGHRILEYIG